MLAYEETKRIGKALEIASQYGGIDEDQAWVIDQMVRVLLKDGYSDWVRDWEEIPGDEFGNRDAKWPVGIAP